MQREGAEVREACRQATAESCSPWQGAGGLFVEGSVNVTGVPVYLSRTMTSHLEALI